MGASPLKRPRSLRIGGSVYRVATRKSRAPRDVYGEIDCVRRRIALAPRLSPAVAARTLVHEALHAAFEESGLSADPVLADLEERVCAALEAPVCSLLADNPALIDFIRKAQA